MTEITLFLSESPTALKKDFLATCTIITASSSAAISKELPQEITFNCYSRESWSQSILSPTSLSSSTWQGLWIKSIDGRKRLPGFTTFLKQRKKAAFGTWTWKSQGANQKPVKAMIVVPYDQPPIPKGANATNLAQRQQDILFVQYCLDETLKKGVKSNSRSGSTPASTVGNVRVKQSVANQAGKKGGVGLLGNLLGAQSRTNQQLDKVRTIKAKPITDSESGTTKNDADETFQTASTTNTSASPTDTTSIGTKTAAQVISSFTAQIEQKLIEFQANQNEHKVELKVSLAEQARQLSPDHPQDKQKLSMDVLKFIVNEQVDDIGMDEWTCVKEASEFSDEALFVVYKQGHVPEDVLEDLNRGELPDEVKMQQRAIQEARAREEKKRLKQLEEDNLKRANTSSTKNGDHSCDDMETLNLNKRDRRTIEEIQRDIQSKRMRSDY